MLITLSPVPTHTHTHTRARAQKFKYNTAAYTYTTHIMTTHGMTKTSDAFCDDLILLAGSTDYYSVLCNIKEKDGEDFY